jgi:predicted metal-dependent peptidase
MDFNQRIGVFLMTAAVPNLTEHDKARSVALVNLMAAPDATFFVRVLLSLLQRWEFAIPTAATDGKEIICNPDFFMSCSLDERIGLMLHETLHVVFFHMLRIGGRDAMIWNMACDYVINLIITLAGFVLPKGALLNKKYTGMAVEQVYDDLIANATKVPKDFTMDLIEPDDDTAADALAEELDGTLIQATIASRMAGDKAGSIPGDVERYVDELMKPQIPWHQILRRFMTSFNKTEYTFRKLNRRFMPKYIMPTQHSEAIANIAVGNDVSCSIGQREHDHCVSEIAGMIRELQPKEVNFLQWDTVIREVDTLKHLDDIEKVKFAGGGGTDVTCLLEWAQEHKPTFLIIFTDGEFRMPTENPGMPIIWLIHGTEPFEPPFGQVIRYVFKQEKPTLRN